MIKKLKNKFNLSGKKILISGTSKGLGKCLVKSFLELDATVITCNRSNSKSFLELERKWRNNFFNHNVDICSLSEISTFVKENKKSLNPIDVIINNAAVLGPMQPIFSIDNDEIKRVMNTNLYGPMFLIQNLLPIISKGGCIINVSSGMGIVGTANSGIYGLSKFALEGFSQILHKDLKQKKIRVNVVDPGGMRTTMFAEANPHVDTNQIPKPNEIVPMFLWLISDEAKKINGERIEFNKFKKKKI